jgi:hypothetical protein
MAGILELLGASTGDAGKDAAINNGILQAGLSLLQSRGRLGPALGQAGMAGLQGFQQAQQHTQLEELKRRQAMQQLPAQFARTPAQTALANGGGPTVANARVAESAQPSFDYQGYANSLAQYDPVAALQLKESLKPKEKAPIKLGAGDTLVDPATFKPIASAPEKEPEQLRTLGIIYGKGSPQYQKAAEALATKMTTHQPATQVSVNTGQKGFDNTLKLRGDFRSEPIYKAHAEVASAHAQIKQSLKQGTPAGDMAGATKIMKILDPGSVVRESELGMAMAATGLLDRVTNYANMVVTGQKLTPRQRQEFQALADALYAESEKTYNAKRGEYQGIAERNQLNVMDVLGPESRPAAAPAPVPGLPPVDAIEAELRRRGGR